MRRLFCFLFILALASAEAQAADNGPFLKEEKRITVSVPSKYRKWPFNVERTLYAPRGFSVSVFAAGLKSPRFMAEGPDGTIFVSLPHEGKIAALPDRDRDGVADSVITFATGLDRPHGLAFMGADLIVAETGRLVLLKDNNRDLKADEKQVITEDIPPDGGHWTRTVVPGPDGWLYVSVGSSCNVCKEKEKGRASIIRFSRTRPEIYATGLRNTVGFEFHPDTKELWGVDNGRDLLGDDIPPEELNRIVRGGDYGWPYCYGDRVPDPDYGSRERCERTVPPEVKMQAHSAPLGVAFGKGLKFPEVYRNSLFIAFHGSWNRTVPTGYKVVAVLFKNGRPSGEAADFITGWLQKGKAWGRPVDPMVGRDGALYLSDDAAGAIYRITYAENR